jgi:hypothetical protein
MNRTTRQAKTKEQATTMAILATTVDVQYGRKDIRDKSHIYNNIEMQRSNPLGYKEEKYRIVNIFKYLLYLLNFITKLSKYYRYIPQHYNNIKHDGPEDIKGKWLCAIDNVSQISLEKRSLELKYNGNRRSRPAKYGDVVEQLKWNLANVYVMYQNAFEEARAATSLHASAAATPAPGISKRREIFKKAVNSLPTNSNSENNDNNDNSGNEPNNRAVINTTFGRRGRQSNNK